VKIFDKYMLRCIELAKLGAGNVAPNPMVGAVLVYNERIIGEGYHKQYGQAHAEVNCVNSVNDENKNLISNSTLFVSLEPCAHTGKTAPCVDLIMAHKIPHVVIGCRDSFEKVNGKGIEKLIAAGIKVDVGILENDCKNLNKYFFTFYEKQRPYIILKWAQTYDGFIAKENNEAIKISNEQVNVLVHKCRTKTAAILVGTKTIEFDNPFLTARKWEGKNPIRFVIDVDLKLSLKSNVFNDDAHTIILNKHKEEKNGNILFYKMDEKERLLNAFVRCCIEQKINAVIIEGGTKTINEFISANLWDEAMVITNTEMKLCKGIQAPILKNEKLFETKNILTNKIDFYKQQDNEFL
jgi:diaminohydroxyphosphoribosylaminopyrimidine deaminase / 5-amino-6-(5-phosphoribosylamino)uracil reductase